MVEEKKAQAIATKGGGGPTNKTGQGLWTRTGQASCTFLFRNITKTGYWPDGRKVEEVLALKKVPWPKSEDDLRKISLTPFFTKIYEKFVVERLLFYTSEKLDTNPYGGRKGISKKSLPNLFYFIHYSQSITQGKMAVMAAMIDFKKAFDKQNHAILVQC